MDEEEFNDYLESHFAVPQAAEVSSDGQVFVGFSSQVKPLRFDEIAAKFLFLGQSD